MKLIHIFKQNFNCNFHYAARLKDFRENFQTNMLEKVLSMLSFSFTSS